MILDFSCTDAFGIQGNDLFFDARYVRLMLLDDKWLKLTQTVPRDSDFLFTVLTDDRFPALSIATIWSEFRLHFMLSVA
ncbi:hypothetical protein D3C87_1667220 [compost metagenome]